MEERIYGFTPSVIDGSERIFEGDEKIELPERYSYRAYLPEVLDQGIYSICVPCTVSAFLNWRENLKNGDTKDNDIALFDIYKSKTNLGEGMTYKEAFKYLKNNGVKSKAGTLKIKSYGKINSILALKYAIVMNGPCCGALPVYSEFEDFWIKRPGDKFYGGHAISIIGYDEDGFFIRNSWGDSFGDDGYTYIKNDEMNAMMEIWTIIE